MAPKTIKFYIINVKLQSSKEGTGRLAAYERLFLELTEGKRRYVKVSKREAITLFPSVKRVENEVSFFYGKIGRGIYFDNPEIRVLKDSNISYESVDQDRLINPVVGTYMFVPGIHRFGLLKEENGISILDLLRFLQSELLGLVDEGDKLEILIEREDSIIDEIFSAKAVFEIKYEISYSNNDALEAQGELFEQTLKNGNIGHLEVDAKSDYHEEGLNLEAIPLLGGGLQVAKKNGTIKKARILPQDSSKIKVVSNKTKPKIDSIEIPEDSDNINISWFKKFFRLYKEA